MMNWIQLDLLIVKSIVRTESNLLFFMKDWPLDEL